MAATIKPDRIDGALLDHGKDFTRCVRIFQVYDIPLPATGFAADILIKSLATSGMPQIGDGHPNITNCTVQRHIVRGMATNQARVEIVYETPVAGAFSPPQGTLLLRDSTVLTTEETSVSELGNVIHVNYQPTVNPTGNSRVTKVATFQKLLPMRQLTIAGIIKGAANRPSEDVLNAIGTVNENPWQGLKKGFWLFSGFTGDTADLGKTISIEASFLTRIHRDWRSFATFRDDRGEIPQDIKQADVNNLRDRKEYSISAIPANGLVAVGLYKMSNFRSIFGIS
jgi:hypothetical protein